jgi:hypothetical protein
MEGRFVEGRFLEGRYVAGRFSLASYLQYALKLIPCSLQIPKINIVEIYFKIYVIQFYF